MVENEYSQCLGGVASALPSPVVYIRNLPQQSFTNCSLIAANLTDLGRMEARVKHA